MILITIPLVVILYILLVYYIHVHLCNGDKEIIFCVIGFALFGIYHALYNYLENLCSFRKEELRNIYKIKIDKYLNKIGYDVKCDVFNEINLALTMATEREGSHILTLESDFHWKIRELNKQQEKTFTRALSPICVTESGISIDFMDLSLTSSRVLPSSLSMRLGSIMLIGVG